MNLATLEAPPSAGLIDLDARDAAAWSYRRLLDQSMELRAFSGQPLAATRQAAIVRLAADLAERGASPREVIELHVSALAAAVRGSGPRRAQAYEGEGTLLVLEVMGHLAAAYRLRALGPEQDDA